MKDITGLTLGAAFEPICRIDFKMTTRVRNIFGEMIDVPTRVNCDCTMSFGDDGIAFKEIPKE